MPKIIYLIIGLAIGFLIGRKAWPVVYGTNPTNQQRAREHQEHLDKILASFGADEEITNDKVEHLLGVSNTSAERYLDQLEKSGKLRQVGNTGKHVIYSKI
jgi:predicted HTH transcriptional regulator